MSYEYRLVFDDAASAQLVIDSLKSSDACVKAQAQEVCLKDRGLQTLAEYDARLTKESDRALWLKINLGPTNLYNELQ
ncbi:hypothetical protein R0J89_20585, partial [Psychrobacter sp. SIMBA_152]